jgi:aromatic ring-opening dioxygenase catalytic subunit (LigB family)
MSGRFQKDPENDRFQEWLIDTCTRRTPEESQKLLAGWDQAPGARYCHPREEHLLPLHLCAGMAGKKAKLIFDEPVAGKRSVAFLWE